MVMDRSVGFRCCGLVVARGWWREGAGGLPAVAVEETTNIRRVHGSSKPKRLETTARHRFSATTYRKKKLPMYPMRRNTMTVATSPRASASTHDEPAAAAGWATVVSQGIDCMPNRVRAWWGGGRAGGSSDSQRMVGCADQ